MTYEVVSYEAFSTGRSTRSDAVVARITPKTKRIGYSDAVLYCHVDKSGKIVAASVTRDRLDDFVQNNKTMALVKMVTDMFEERTAGIAPLVVPAES